MRFVETPVFTKAVTSLFDDDQYRSLQLALALRPEQGGPYSRKWRSSETAVGYSRPGQARWSKGDLLLDKPTETFYMLFVYTKREQGDLTSEQTRIHGKLVRKEFK